MLTHKIKYGENCVFEDKISITINDVLSKYIWFGHVFYLPVKQKNMFIPANNNGWKWLLNEKDIGLTSSGLKLLCNEETKSFLAVFYENEDPAPYPLTLGLSIPEFLGNVVAVITEDEACRTKSFVHDVKQPIFIDDVKFTLENLTHKNLELRVETE